VKLAESAAINVGVGRTYLVIRQGAGAMPRRWRRRPCARKSAMP